MLGRLEYDLGDRQGFWVFSVGYVERRNSGFKGSHDFRDIVWPKMIRIGVQQCVYRHGLPEDVIAPLPALKLRFPNPSSYQAAAYDKTQYAQGKVRCLDSCGTSR